MIKVVTATTSTASGCVTVTQVAGAAEVDE